MQNEESYSWKRESLFPLGKGSFVHSSYFVLNCPQRGRTRAKGQGCRYSGKRKQAALSHGSAAPPCPSPRFFPAARALGKLASWAWHMFLCLAPAVRICLHSLKQEGRSLELFWVAWCLRSRHSDLGNPDQRCQNKPGGLPELLKPQAEARCSPVQFLVPKIVCTGRCHYPYFTEKKSEFRRWWGVLKFSAYSEKTGSEPWMGSSQISQNPWWLPFIPPESCNHFFLLWKAKG